MSLAPGALIGPFQITAGIGAGGMGVVYRARDTQLNRDVALKVLPDSVAHDPERLGRFRREAQLLAALNHPNIATVYGLEESAGAPALVMELVEGSTLADRIAQGAIPLDEALSIAEQLADALEAAHERGIIHRDLKPANIKIRTDGRVKVLDFGLAKLLEPAAVLAEQAPAGGTGDDAATYSPTLSAAATRAGLILGTAAYMSPEQARGKSVDKRTDIWAFGCVLYEMLTGRRAFHGEDAVDVLSAVARFEPAWDRLPTALPPAVVTLLKACLTKDARQRVGDIAAVQFVLRERAHLVRAATQTGSSHRRQLNVAAILTVGVGISSLFTTWIMSRPPTARPVVRLAVQANGDATPAYDANDRAIAISPEGTRVAYTAARTGLYRTGIDVGLFVRTLSQLEPSLIAGPGNIREPFFSTDGAWVGFFEPNTRMKKVLATGGPAVALATIDGNSRGASWSRDDVIVFATSNPSTGLQRVPAGGGEPVVLTRPDRTASELDHYWPHVLPSGQAVVFTIVPDGPIENASIAVLDLRDGSQKILVRGGTDGRYVSSGHLVFSSGGTLQAVAFDPERLEVYGTPAPVLQDTLTTATTGAANFSVADDGTLAYLSGTREGSQRTLIWVDRSGREEPLGTPVRAYQYPRISPDGSRVAIDVRDEDDDIWIWDFARRTLTRLTFDPGGDEYPVWLPDGRSIVFGSGPPNAQNLYWQSADGTGTPSRITQSRNDQDPMSITPDGRLVLFRNVDAATRGTDIRSTPLAGSSVAQTAQDPTDGEPVLQGPFDERNAEVSPDGHWLAYESNETRRAEIYVRPFPNVAAGRWQVSNAGGRRPLWAPNGQELFYVAPDNTLLSVRVTPGREWSSTPPIPILKGEYFHAFAGGRSYDISPDGKRFLFIKSGENDTPVSLVVTLNWLEELKRLVPATAGD
jgi:serine/threonine-protein kinase